MYIISHLCLLISFYLAQKMEQNQKAVWGQKKASKNFDILRAQNTLSQQEI